MEKLASKPLNGEFSGSICVLVIWGVSGCVATSVRCFAPKSLVGELSGSIGSLGGIDSAIIHDNFRSSKSLNGDFSGIICSSNLGRFRVYRNELQMSCFQVVECRVLRKHRFVRWYRFSDYPVQFSFF